MASPMLAIRQDLRGSVVEPFLERFVPYVPFYPVELFEELEGFLRRTPGLFLVFGALTKCCLDGPCIQHGRHPPVCAGSVAIAHQYAINRRERPAGTSSRDQADGREAGSDAPAGCPRSCGSSALYDQQPELGPLILLDPQPEDLLGTIRAQPSAPCTALSRTRPSSRILTRSSSKSAAGKWGPMAGRARLQPLTGRHG